MSDRDHAGAAWRVAPSDYAETREAAYALLRAPISRYLTMRDGCRIAVDVWLPEGVSGPVPANLILTPYYRRIAVQPGSDADAIPNAGKFIRFLVPLTAADGLINEGMDILAEALKECAAERAA